MLHRVARSRSIIEPVNWSDQALSAKTVFRNLCLSYHCRMTDLDRFYLLCDLHEGRTSRNREFERFSRTDEFLVFCAYARIKGIIKDLENPEVKGSAHWVENTGRLAITLESSQLSYRRRVYLSHWEVDFIKTRTSLADLLAPSNEPQTDF